MDGLEPPSLQCVAVSPQLSALLYQLSYTTHRIYSLIQAAGSHTNLRHTTQSPSALLDLQSGFSIQFVLYVAVERQPYSAFNSHNFPRTCATTCQPYCSHRDQPVVIAGSEITSLRPVVLTGWVPSLSTPSALMSISLPFQLRALHEPRHLSVGHGVITATAYSPPILPLCIQSIQPTCRDCSLHVPRRLWKVAESNRLLIRGFLMSPIPWHYRSVGILFHLCLFAPTIQAFPFLLFFLLPARRGFPATCPYIFIAFNFRNLPAAIPALISCSG